MLDYDLVMVSDWMENGPIKWYLEGKPPKDKLRLVRHSLVSVCGCHLLTSLTAGGCCTGRSILA